MVDSAASPGPAQDQPPDRVQDPADWPPAADVRAASRRAAAIYGAALGLLMVALKNLVILHLH